MLVGNWNVGAFFRSWNVGVGLVLLVATMLSLSVSLFSKVLLLIFIRHGLSWMQSSKLNFNRKFLLQYVVHSYEIMIINSIFKYESNDTTFVSHNIYVVRLTVGQKLRARLMKIITRSIF